MVPGFRRDGVWTPAFAGVTKFERFARTSLDFVFDYQFLCQEINFIIVCFYYFIFQKGEPEPIF
jgi:hypothetical protein